MIGRFVKRAFISIGVLLLVAISSLLIWRAVLQHQAAAAIRIPSPAGIDSLEKVQLGGVEQWITIRGHDRAQPLLLFLHGGPGLPEMPFAHVNAELEKHFLVVEWDQRGSGKSFSSHIPAETMTLNHLSPTRRSLLVCSAAVSIRSASSYWSLERFRDRRPACRQASGVIPSLHRPRPGG